MNFLWLLVVGLSSMKVTELVKEIVPWPLRPWTRSLVSIAVAIALSAWLSADVRGTILLGLGAAGLAMVLHEIQAVLSYAGDNFKQAVIIRSAGRVR